MSPELPPNPIVYREPEEQPGLIQGRTPDSRNEWFVSLALDKLELAYMYQYALGGGAVRGGQFVDFVVFTPLGSIPVFVQGSYWHAYRQDPEGILKQAEAARVFKNEAVLLEEDETDTRAKALAAVRKNIPY